MSEEPLGKGDILDDRFEIDTELGRGGSAFVYRALDRRTGQRVAIKVLRPELVESLAASRFEKEIRRHQGLNHPNIVPVLDFGASDGLLYCVLPLMEEGTLRTRLDAEKQLPITDAINIARDVAVALAYVHSNGLVHRDIKPENILFSGGRTYLGDFGITRALITADGETTTTVGIVRGTGPYMSPEQAAGEHHYDGRSDIYSLGCVMYEMLAGMQPFVGPTPQSVISQRLAHEPRPVAVYRPELPAPLVAVVDRALRLSVSERFNDAQQMVDALDGALHATNVPRKTSRLSRAGWGGVAAAVIMLAAAFVLKNQAIDRPRSDVTSDIPDGDPRRIAVLYLENLSPGTLPSHIVDGITEDLIDQLAAVRALRVISQTGVRPFRDNPVAPDSLARLLKVGTIVSGSVARSGDVLRVNVRLTDARNSELTGTLQLGTPWQDVFAFQDTLAERVAFELRKKLGDGIALRMHRLATRSLPAWENAQLASAALRRAVEAATVQNDPRAPLLYMRADSLYAASDQLDPQWMYPRIRRGRIAFALSFRSPLPPHLRDSLSYSTLSVKQQRAVWLRRSIELANSVLQQSPGTPEALALRGDAQFALARLGDTLSDSLIIAAERDLKSALEKRPDIARAWATLAEIEMNGGRFADAAASARKAFDSDPFFEVRRIVSVGFFTSLFAEQYDEAGAWCKFGLTHYRGDPRFTECELTLLGWTGNSAGHVTNAWQLVSDIEKRDTLHMLDVTWDYRRFMVAAILARARMSDSAHAVLGRVSERQATDTTMQRLTLPEGYVRLLLGQHDQALQSISRRLKDVPNERSLVLKTPWFRPLHSDPRFTALAGQRP